MENKLIMLVAVSQFICKYDMDINIDVASPLVVFCHESDLMNTWLKSIFFFAIVSRNNFLAYFPARVC